MTIVDALLMYQNKYSARNRLCWASLPTIYGRCYKYGNTSLSRHSLFGLHSFLQKKLQLAILLNLLSLEWTRLLWWLIGSLSDYSMPPVSFTRTKIYYSARTLNVAIWKLCRKKLLTILLSAVKNQYHDKDKCHQFILFGSKDHVVRENHHQDVEKHLQ